MFKELFDEVTKLARQAHTPTVVERRPGVDLLTRDSNGSIEVIYAEPPRANLSLFSVEDLGRLAVDLLDSDEAEFCQAVYCRAGAVLLTEPKDYRHRSTLHLTYSPQLLEVQALEKTAKALDQRALLWLLRTTFKSCLAKAGNIIESLRKMRWETASVADADIKRGKASYGNSVVAAVTGIEAVPEYVTLQIPIFAAYFQSVQDIEFVLDPDEATKTFKFFPLPGAIEKAIQAAEQDLGVAVKAAVPEAVPVYFGATE